jgi:hypothetical protein
MLKNNNMDREKEMQELRARLKELTASQYRRFNVLLKKEAFAKLDEEAKKRKMSKAKTLGQMILSN